MNYKKLLEYVGILEQILEQVDDINDLDYDYDTKNILQIQKLDKEVEIFEALKDELPINLRCLVGRLRWRFEEDCKNNAYINEEDISNFIEKAKELASELAYRNLKDLDFDKLEQLLEEEDYKALNLKDEEDLAELEDLYNAIKEDL